MKASGQFQKKPIAPSAPIPLSTGLFDSRPFPKPSTTTEDAMATKPDLQARLDFARRSAPNLQRLAANSSRDRATMLAVQPKLTVGAPNDQYEQEADRVADQVMSTPDAAVQQPVQREAMPEAEEALQTKPIAATITPLVQREAMPEEEEVQAKPIATLQREEAMPEEEELQMKPFGDSIQREEMPEDTEELQTKPIATLQREEMPEEEEIQTKSWGSIQREEMPEEEVQTKPALQRVLRKTSLTPDGSLQTGSSIESQLNSSKGGGSPLSDEVRSFMEPRFGADFSQVRVHTGSEAVQMNRDLNAQAFTHHQDVYFGAGKAPGKDDLTAHELTHVVQQTGSIQKKNITGGKTLQLKCESCDEESKLMRQTIDHNHELNTSRTGSSSLLQPSFKPEQERSYSEDCSKYIGQPSFKSCEFYRCREANNPNKGGSQGYYIGYGLKYCYQFSQLHSQLSSAGKSWNNKTRLLLMQHVNNNIPWDASSDEVMSSAFASHPTAYLDAGICSLPVSDWGKIVKTIDFADNPGGSLKQSILTGVGCLGEWAEKYAEKYGPLITPPIFLKAMPEGEKLQRKPSFRLIDGSLQAGGNIEGKLSSSNGGGSPLSDEVRSFMEPRFGADFSQVRVHTGSDAVQMNRDLNAQAFTYHQDVYFGAGKTPGKDDLTAHELTHVVQQTRHSPADVTPRSLRMQSLPKVALSAEAIQAKKRPGQTPEGQARIDAAEENLQNRLLCDFDIDDANLKPAHTASLDEMLKFISADFEKRKESTEPLWLIGVDGFASRTGTAEHNQALSKEREESTFSYINYHLFDNIRPVDAESFESRIVRDPKFHGFNKTTVEGEHPLGRSVQVLMKRPNLPIPPPQQNFPATRSKKFQIRCHTLASAGIPIPGVPGGNVALDFSSFEITDLQNNQEAFFDYKGKGVSAGIPLPDKLPKLIKDIVANTTFSLAGAFVPFETTRPVKLKDFSGSASLVQPPGIAFPGIGSLSIGKPQIAFKSPAFGLGKAKIIPPILEIDTGTSFGLTILSSTDGELILRQ